MTPTATSGLVMVGAFVVLLMVAAVAFVELDREGVRGALIGAGLGLLNLVVGYLVTRRTLRNGTKSAMTTVAGGFIIRLVVVVGLMVLFQRTGAADPAAFALTFLVFFFVYMGVEVLLVERSLDGTGRAV
jgi:zinc transporter ZupT